MLAAATLLLVSAPASAATLRWDLDNVTFQDQGTATGYFVFDSDAQSVLDWSITVSPWTYPGPTGAPINSPAFTYDKDSAGNITSLFPDSPYGINFIDSTQIYEDGQTRQIRLSFTAALDAPGVVPLYLDSVYGSECWNCTPFRDIVGGSVASVSAVPEPSTYVLMIAGLLGLGVLARRRRA